MSKPFIHVLPFSHLLLNQYTFVYTRLFLLNENDFNCGLDKKKTIQNWNDVGSALDARKILKLSE